MKHLRLAQNYGEEVNVTLKDGMGFIMYTDEGPTGITGQCMSITCPHAIFAIYENEEKMKEGLKKLREGRNKNIQYGVVGQWDVGNCQIVIGD